VALDVTPSVDTNGIRMPLGHRSNFAEDAEQEAHLKKAK